MRPEQETRLASTFEGQHETVAPRLGISVHKKIPNLLMMRCLNVFRIIFNDSSTGVATQG